MFLFNDLWSSMILIVISYEASVAQICVLFRLYDRQWSLTKPRSPKYVSYLDSMIVNDLLQSLGRPNMCLIRLNDRQWSFICVLWSSRPNMSYLDSQWSFMKPYLDSMIVNDLLWSLGLPNMCLFIIYDRQWSLTKPRSPKYVFLFA